VYLPNAVGGIIPEAVSPKLIYPCAVNGCVPEAGSPRLARPTLGASEGFQKERAPAVSSIANNGVAVVSRFL